MYLCYVCHASLDSIPGLHSHIRRHEAAGELTLPIRCCQEKCTSSFTTVWNLKRHITQYHKQSSWCSDREEPCFGAVQAPLCNSDDDESAVESVGLAKRAKLELSDIHQEGVALVASLRSNSGLPHNVVPQVVASFNHMADCAVDYLKEQVLEPLKCVPNISEDILIHVEQSLNSVQQPLNFLSSKFKQDEFFSKHPLFVNSQTLTIGSRYEVKGGKNKLVYDTYEYVSVESNLRSLLQNEDFVKLVVAERCRDLDILDSFQDGERCKRHYLFGDSTKLALMVQLFYDGMGTTNPLRGNASTSNVGVFYYTIQNIPPSHNSCFANVHLLALCYSQDLKVHCYDSVLERFVSEMQKLQSVGFSGDFPIIGTKQIYAGLCQVACDNLALNGIFGFIECFSSNYFCTLCLATKEEIQVKTDESEFEMRTIANYNADVEALKKLTSGNHSRGIKNNCSLNKIPGFHVVDNYVLDPMHTLLEGIVPFELGCILNQLINVNHYFSLADLNTCMHQFFDRNGVEKSKRPPTINCIEKPGGGLSPSMKAVQMLALLKYLPMFLGKYVPEDDIYWLFLINLCELVDIVFAPKFTKGMIAYLRVIISDHLVDFKQLFGQVAKLRPKHHFLVHFPTIIAKNGPLAGMSCLRYEMKNSFFKRSSGVVCNFINICKTLAYRHQCNAFYARLSKQYLRTTITVGNKKSEYKQAGLAGMYRECLCGELGIGETEMVCFAWKLNVASLVYRKGQCFVIGRVGNGNPLFGEVEAFVSLPYSDNWFAVVYRCITTCFHSHLYAYEMQRYLPIEFACISLDCLCDHNPLFSYSQSGGGKRSLIRLPYHIIC